MEDYNGKGEFASLNGMKTYVTGPKDADTAILSIYDIFGLGTQTIQGADILAHSDDSRGYQVYVPQFFGNEPADKSWYPPDTDDKKAKLGPWFEKNAPPVHLPRVAGVIEDAQKHNPNIKKWGVIGYCWGGKMVSLLGGQDSTPFSAGVQTSPAMVDPSDAEKIKIPMCVLASQDEDAGDVKKYGDNLKVKKHVEIYSDSPHGFMSARADMSQEKSKADYIKGYQTALTFFHDNL